MRRTGTARTSTRLLSLVVLFAFDLAIGCGDSTKCRIEGTSCSSGCAGVPLYAYDSSQACLGPRHVLECHEGSPQLSSGLRCCYRTDTNTLYAVNTVCPVLNVGAWRACTSDESTIVTKARYCT